jgi:thiamine transport system substrate-binding protein
MKRRDFLKAGTGTGLVLLAGCTSNSKNNNNSSDNNNTTNSNTHTTNSGDPYSGTLTVATYRPFIDAGTVSPGKWIKEQFEAAYPKATLKWATPKSELNYFIQRKRRGVNIDADVYVGLNVDDLLRVEQNLDSALFDTGLELEGESHVIDQLRFDPKGRAVPFDTGYICLVYDKTQTTNPGTFDTLATPEFASKLLAQNAQTGDTGRAFLLWTVATLGENNYLDYWNRLVGNGAKIVDSWTAAYAAYSNDERPIVVSYSTDQVYAHRNNKPLKEHQVGFLNNQGYANPEGMARFADTDNPELATAFLEFMLSKKVQSKIPVLNVSFPATDYADPPESFSKYAYRPPETVTHSYKELKGSVDTWIEQWSRQVVSK